MSERIYPVALAVDVQESLWTHIPVSSKGKRKLVLKEPLERQKYMVTHESTGQSTTLAPQDYVPIWCRIH